VPNFYPQHFFQNVVRREIGELFLSVIIRDFAISMVGIFVPVYFYTLGFSLLKITLYYALIYTLYLFLIPVGAHIASRRGFEHSILYSIPFLILQLLLLFLLPKWPFIFYLLPLVVVIYKSLYWPAYHADFAHYTKEGQRGREVSTLQVLSSILTVIGPIAGGFIIGVFGFKILFIVVSIILFASAVPLFTTKEQFIPDDFYYKHAFRRLFRKENRSSFFGFIGTAEFLVQEAFWPIFIFLVVESYLSLGAITSIATFVGVGSLLYFGHLADKKDRFRLIQIFTWPLSILYFVRIFAKTAFDVLLVNIFAAFVRPGTDVPIISIVYKKGRDIGHHLRYVVFYEMSLIIGKMIISWLLVIIFLFREDIIIPFILAGLFTLLYLFIRKPLKVDRNTIKSW